MTFEHFILPAGTGWIEGKKSDQLVGLRGHIPGDGAVGNPQSGQMRFAAEDDRLIAGCRAGVVFVPSNGEIYLCVSAGLGSLPFEVFRKVFRILPVMTVDVD